MKLTISLLGIALFLVQSYSLVLDRKGIQYDESENLIHAPVLEARGTTTKAVTIAPKTTTKCATTSKKVSTTKSTTKCTTTPKTTSKTTLKTTTKCTTKSTTKCTTTSKKETTPVLTTTAKISTTPILTTPVITTPIITTPITTPETTPIIITTPATTPSTAPSTTASTTSSTAPAFPVCLPDGSDCTFSDACCNDFCNVDDSGAGTCQSNVLGGGGKGDDPSSGCTQNGGSCIPDVTVCCSKNSACSNINNPALGYFCVPVA